MCFDLNESIATQERFPAQKLTSFEPSDSSLARRSVVTYLCCYVSFKPDCSASEAECFSAMEKCIRAVRTWMIQDKMKLNDDKTEFFIIGTSQQLKKVRI